MVGIIDYGVGNLFSLRSSFAAIGVEAFVSGDAAELAKKIPAEPVYCDFLED